MTKPLVCAMDRSSVAAVVILEKGDIRSVCWKGLVDLNVGY